MELKELESAIEGILFAAGDPMSEERLLPLIHISEPKRPY